MPGETPDWGALSAQATAFPVTDLGELAVRLGSIDSFDRRGDVLLLDDFEDGVDKWEAVLGGSGDSVTLSFARARNGRYSVLLTAAAAASPSARILRQLPYPVLSRFGLEVSFNFDAAVARLTFLFQLEDGTDRSVFAVRWEDADGELQYQDSSGSYVAFATGVDPQVPETLFHTLKLVVDGVNGNYVRVLYDDREYDLAGIAGAVSASAVSPRLTLMITLTGTDGQSQTVYVDDVITTQNEPA